MGMDHVTIGDAFDDITALANARIAANSNFEDNALEALVFEPQVIDSLRK